MQACGIECFQPQLSRQDRVAALEAIIVEMGHGQVILASHRSLYPVKPTSEGAARRALRVQQVESKARGLSAKRDSRLAKQARRPMSPRPAVAPLAEMLQGTDTETETPKPIAEICRDLQSSKSKRLASGRRVFTARRPGVWDFRCGYASTCRSTAKPSRGSDRQHPGIHPCWQSYSWKSLGYGQVLGFVVK